jgi:ssDNA-binding Zn-finger/Zn-ribbon topoisomerase 1
MIKRKTKPRRKIIANKTGRDCPRCGHPLVKRVNGKTREKFIGCSNFPNCNYIQAKTIIDYACESLGVEWRPNIQKEVVWLLDDIVRKKLGSRDEVEYMLGAAYYLDHLYGNHNNEDGIELYKTEIECNGKMYDGMAFLEPFVYWGGGIAPSAMAFVPQVGFGEKLHHDFGVFFSGDHAATSKDWDLDFAVEIDIHPHHEYNAGMDKFRDSLVKYPVLRLHPSRDEPLKWFRKAMSLFSRNYED